jgi:hypothetical protein
MGSYRTGYWKVMDATERIERRLKLHELRVLISVVDGGSMGKAAKHLATSQPAVSRAIADLEYSLGVRLLDRGPMASCQRPMAAPLSDGALRPSMS